MEDTSSSRPHYQISFFSNNENYRHIPSYTLSVPTDVTVDDLNALANKVLSDVSNEELKPVIFDFLISATILRTTLEEFVQENYIPVESVISIECIVQEPEPEPAFSVTLPDWVGAIRSNDHFIASTTYAGELTLWNHSGKKLTSSGLHEDAIKCVAILPDQKGNRIVTGGHDQILMVSDIETDDELSWFIKPSYVLRGHERSVEAVVVNSDGTRTVSGGFDKMLKVWNTDKDDASTVFENVDDGRINKKKKTNVITKTPMVTLAGHKDAVVGAVWSPNSAKEVITVSWDHTISIWDLELAGQSSTLGGKKAFTSISICPSSNMLITGSVDPLVRLWDPRSHEGTLMKLAFIGHNGWITSVFWNQTKENLFISASFDKTVKMWDIRSNKTPLYDLIGHKDRILCCDWSVNEMILSGSADCTLKAYRKKVW